MPSRREQIKMWENPQIHLGLLNDKLRNKAYRKAIKKVVSSSCSVLDVGSGIGILGFLSLMSGAKHVTMVEWSDIIKYARKIAKLNGLSQKITFVQEDIMKFKSSKKFDIITHELIGGMLWDENILPLIQYARDQFLKPKGKLLPWKIDLYLAPAYCRDYIPVSLNKTDSIYGIDFSPADNLIHQINQKLKIPTVDFFSNDSIFLLAPELAYSINLYETDGKLPNQIEVQFDFPKFTNWNAVIGYFDIWLDDTVIISNYPASIQTNWGQFVIPLGKSYPVKKNSQIRFTLFPSRYRTDWNFKLDYLFL